MPVFLLAKRSTVAKFFLNDLRSYNICPLTDSGADRFDFLVEWGGFYFRRRACRLSLAMG